MKIHESLYPHIEVSQCIAIDNNFRGRSGVLTLVDLSDEGEIVTAYEPGEGESPLSVTEKATLSRILYGWGPKKHYCTNTVVQDQWAKVRPASFAKIKNSQDKSLIHLVPLNVIKEVADVYTSNFAHYGEDWKGLPNAKDVFYNAMMRHLISWHSGEKVDPEDGKLHIIKVVGNAIFLAWHELRDRDGKH